MEDTNLTRDGHEPAAGKEPYEAPEAAVVRVELSSRVGGCNFSSIQVCGLTE
ncbi:MAG TPA: hypothetical protein PLP83_04610 [Candidatus Aminicenantes bacterium]|nr:hypothetical protein [Candidatus Aminicenantes bacterium]